MIDPDRGTGRTIRMLLTAMVHLTDQQNEKVFSVVVGHNHNYTSTLFYQFLNLYHKSFGNVDPLQVNKNNRTISFNRNDSQQSTLMFLSRKSNNQLQGYRFNKIFFDNSIEYHMFRDPMTVRFIDQMTRRVV